MSQEFINGTKFAFSSVLGAAVNITAITNANPPVITADTPPTAGNVLLLKSGWSELIDQCCYAGAGSTLQGLDTSDTTHFPPGEGAGSYQVASSFVSLSQIRTADQSGGDQNQFTWGYIEDRSSRQRSKPTDKNPLILTFTLDEDVSLPWYQPLIDIDKKKQITVMRETSPSGDVLLYAGYLSFQKSPTRVRNENKTVTAVMTINSDILRYPASFFSGS